MDGPIGDCALRIEHPYCVGDESLPAGDVGLSLGTWIVDDRPGGANDRCQIRLLGNSLPAEIAKLLGHLSLLFGLSLYARHVILHAQGLLPARKRKAAKEKLAREGKTARDGQRQFRGDGHSTQSSGAGQDKNRSPSTHFA